MAVKNAAALLDDFCAAGIAVEVTHRVEAPAVRADRPGAAARRGAPAAPAGAGPRPRPAAARPAEDAGRRARRCRPCTPLDRRPFDYSDLDHWMAQMDQTIRQRRAPSAL